MLTGFVIGWAAGLIVGITLWETTVCRDLRKYLDFWHGDSERWFKVAMRRGR